jgi:hypothetical protein
MARIMAGILGLLLAVPALRAEDKPKEKSATPAEQYQALVKEHGKAQQAFFEAYQKASTDEAKQKLLKEQYPDFAPKFLALAEKYPKDPAALDALVWIATQGIYRPKGTGEQSLAKALDLLVRDHLASEKLGQVCRRLAQTGSDKATNAFLSAVLEKSPRKDVQAEACFARAQRSLRTVELVEQLKKNPEAAKQYAQYFGQEYVDDLLKQDVGKLKAASEKFMRRFTDKHLGDLPAQRLASLCSSFAYSSDTGSERVLRALLEKDARAEVQGPACLFLAKVLWKRAESLADPKSAEAAKLLKESEELLERAAQKYADVKVQYYGTVGKKAKSELFSIRHLAVGKVAPDIAAEDQDGKKLKLSDYRGKVVLLDFWSQY